MLCNFKHLSEVEEFNEKLLRWSAVQPINRSSTVLIEHVFELLNIIVAIACQRWGSMFEREFSQLLKTLIITFNWPLVQATGESGK